MLEQVRKILTTDDLFVTGDITTGFRRETQSMECFYTRLNDKKS